MTRRELSPTPDWLTGIEVRVDEESNAPVLKCRECNETICHIEPSDSLWVLVDVSRDHRHFCRDKEERLP